ncbi:PASTA domain-containing protein [Streptomyces sp. 378]|uniref:PASTA domain-containing protein n=1 Tax=Streptomyces sp. 378 TaxID=3049412 RepID=UPI0024C3F0A1|nr:PASTA domain-containing protein [Streptomyces sp. 378]MDK1346302.1 PASTA domain-containing protein [Streptomyces sp. 378]
MNRGEKGLFGGIAVLAVVLLLLLLGSCGDNCDDAASTPAAPVTITATPSPAGSQVGQSVDSALERVGQTGLSVAVHDASDRDENPGGDWTVCFEKATLSKVDFAAVPDGAPCPKKDGQRIPWPKMPNVQGSTYADAVEKLGDAVGAVAIEAAYEDEAAYDTNNGAGEYANWKVCFQSVKAGTRLAQEPDVVLHAVEKDETCPSSKGLYKNAENDPDYRDREYAEPDDGTSAGDGSSANGGSSGDSGSSEEDYSPGDKGGCPPGGCYNPCPPGGCR